MKRFGIILLIMCCFDLCRGQEFRPTVAINYQKLLTTTQSYESSDKRIFESMKQAVEDFVGGRRWTNLEFAQNERIDCSISIILSQRTSATDFGGQLTIQLKRPVYNSTYTTGLLNYLEQANFMFSFNETQTLEFDPNNFDGNLSSTLAFYCYIMLGMYLDSYGHGAGEPMYEMARIVAQTAEGSSYSGWRSTEGAKSRYWFMENHTNSAYAPIHNVYYRYHRLGLDMMTRDQLHARQSIIAALEELRLVHKQRPNLLCVTQFVDVKIQEIVSIFTPAPDDEKKRVYELVKEISPINVVKLKGFPQK